MTVQNPHDRFFRESFSRPDIVRNYLEEYLPANVRDLLKLDTLTQQDGSFIDEAMQEHQTDLLYQVQLHSGTTATLYFLFEHKSYPDPLVGLQLLRYMVRFWERQVKEKEPLTPIIPLVIYHGEKAWHTPTEFLELMDVPEALRPFLPDFRYHLNDFSYLSDETIRGEIWLRVSLSVLRSIFNPQLRHELEPLITLIFELHGQRTGLEYIRTILYYLSRATERVSREDLQTALLRQGAEGERAMMTIAQEFIQQGIEQGIEQGLQDSILDLLAVRFGDVPPEIVQWVTAVSQQDTLRSLNRAAIQVESLSAFNRLRPD
ncbi:MAG: Rpn family recombination-promoting nuclease/putative transposase [Anaerolineae bacterium]|nr:Rpn family recombination-promoting nuclease/putative transposase [Anaerolineae bacterium]